MSKIDLIAGFPILLLQASSLEECSTFSFKSAPAEKLFPLPVKITTLVTRSLERLLEKFVISISNSELRALREPGLLSST